MYFLYDVVWVLADHEEFNRLLEEGCTILWIDLCYCFLFSIYNLGFGTLLLKSRLLRFFQKKKILILSAIFLLANTFLAFLVENLIDVLFVDISDREVWGNAYLMGLISSIQALIVVVEYYYKESEQKYEENRQLEMFAKVRPHRACPPSDANSFQNAGADFAVASASVNVSSPSAIAEATAIAITMR